MLSYAMTYAFGSATVGDLIYFVNRGLVPRKLLEEADFIYLHCGTNNVSKGKSGAIVRHMQQLIKLLLEINCKLTIVVGSILPRKCDFDQTNEEITAINMELAGLCKSLSQAHFHRSYRTFLDGDALRTDQALFASDGLHLSLCGKNRLLRMILNVIDLWK